MRLLVDDVAELAGPDGGDDEDLAREAGEADLNALLVLGHGRPQVAAVLTYGGARLVLVLVVEPHARRRPGRAEPVDAQPGADLVVGPGVRVGPVVELLVWVGQITARSVFIIHALEYRRCKQTL